MIRRGATVSIAPLEAGAERPKGGRSYWVTALVGVPVTWLLLVAFVWLVTR